MKYVDNIEPLADSLCCVNGLNTYVVEYVLLILHIFGLIGIILLFVGVAWDAVASGMEAFLFIIFAIFIGSLAISVILILFRRKGWTNERKNNCAVLMCTIMIIVSLLGFLLSLIFFIVVADQMRKSGDEDDPTEVEEVTASDWALTIIGILLLCGDWILLFLAYVNLRFRIKARMDGPYLHAIINEMTLGVVNRNSNSSSQGGFGNKERVVRVSQNQDMANRLSSPFGNNIGSINNKPETAYKAFDIRKTGDSYKSDQTPPQFKTSTGHFGNFGGKIKDEINKNSFGLNTFNPNKNSAFGSAQKIDEDSIHYSTIKDNVKNNYPNLNDSKHDYFNYNNDNNNNTNQGSGINNIKYSSNNNGDRIDSNPYNQFNSGKYSIHNAEFNNENNINSNNSNKITNPYENIKSSYNKNYSDANKEVNDNLEDSKDIQPHVPNADNNTNINNEGENDYNSGMTGAQKYDESENDK